MSDTALPEIWVVFCNGEIMGIYPNDESKAQSTVDILLEGRYKARIVKYLAEAAMSETMCKCPYAEDQSVEWHIAGSKGCKAGDHGIGGTRRDEVRSHRDGNGGLA